MMNKLIQDIAEHCDFYVGNEHYDKSYEEKQRLYMEKFTEMIVEECRTVVVKLYHETPLELCGPLLTADERIASHFYGDEK